MKEPLHSAILPLEEPSARVVHLQALARAGARMLPVPAGSTVHLEPLVRAPGFVAHGPVAGVVESGRLLLKMSRPSTRPVVVAMADPGDPFGSFSDAIGDGRWPARGWLVEAWALVPSRALLIPGRDLHRLIELDPDLARWFAQAAAHRAEAAERRLAAALSLPVAERVLLALAELRPPGAGSPGGSIRSGHLVTQELLAAMVGATRESVNRAMRSLAREGRVRRRGRAYSVVAAPRP